MPNRYHKAVAQGPMVPGPVADWGRFTRYLEIAPDDFALRHVDQFDCSRYLRYDRDHWIDEFGMLAEALLDEEFTSRHMVAQLIEKQEFETVWHAAGAAPEWQLQLSTAMMDRFPKRTRPRSGRPLPPWLFS